MSVMLDTGGISSVKNYKYTHSTEAGRVRQNIVQSIPMQMSPWLISMKIFGKASDEHSNSFFYSDTNSASADYAECCFHII